MKKLLFFLLITIGFSLQHSLIANEPDSAYVFAYATDKNAGRNGLHFAWSTDRNTWHSIGPERTFLRSEYAKVDNGTFKLMKRNLPGAFTFILNGTTRLPKIFRNRKEVGIRMPGNSIIQEIARLLDAPIMTTTLPYDEDEDIEYITDPELIDEKFGNAVDLVIDGGIGGTEGSTVVNCTNGEPEIVRQGKGWLDEG
mgnify:CR=1 FL=1